MNYEYITTFWQDFSIAEPFGKSAIRDTAKRAFEEWKDNVSYLTELVMVINHKCWYWAGTNDSLSHLYSDLYYKYDDMAIAYLENNGSKEDLTYYFKTLD